jgi:hypothetical protein
MIIEHLFEHQEGATIRELTDALGAQFNAVKGAVAQMALDGDVITARDKKPMKVTWDIVTDYGPGSYKRPENKRVERIEHKAVFRLSPDKWIELAS